MRQVVSFSLPNLKSQFATSSWGRRRKLPYVFTEQGVAMLAGVLKSEKAIQVNIEIMRTFVLLRKMALQYSEISDKIESLEAKYDAQFVKSFYCITIFDKSKIR